MDAYTDKTNDDVVLTPPEKGAPAIFVRMNSQTGPNNSIEMSFGIPLDMTPADLNAYIDKVAACAERQSDKGILVQAKMALKQAYEQIETNNANLAAYELKAAQEYVETGRRGDWEPNGKQRAEIKNFERTSENFRSNVIPRLEKQIADLEAKIAGD